MSAADPEERWFNAVKIRLLAWVAVGVTIPAMGLAGGLLLSSINTTLTELKDGQKASNDRQLTTSGQVQAVQQNVAVMSATITEGLVKSVQSAIDVNAQQQAEINNLRDRLGVAEGDLKTLRALQELRLPNPGSK